MEFLKEFVAQYGTLAAFLLIFLEYACFPMPSEVILPLSGAVAALNGDSFWYIFLGSILCALLGSLVCYCLGRFGGAAILRLGNRFTKLKKGMDASQNAFNRYSGMAVGLSRVIPICRTYISVVAGLTRQKLSAFCLYSTMGIAVWNAVLIYLGYILEKNWASASGYYDSVKNYILPAVLGVVALVLLVKWLRRRRGACQVVRRLSK